MTDDRTQAAPEDPLREQLLEAAAAVFASKGYAGTRIMDIVKEAGLSSGAVYGRFASKDELLMAAVLSRIEHNAGARRFKGGTVAEMLVEASRAKGQLTDAEAMQLEAFVAARREPELQRAITEARKRWRTSYVESVVQRAIADGSASPDADFDSVVYFMETLNLGLLVQRGADQSPPDDAAWRRFLEGIIRAMASAPRAAPRRHP